MSYVIVYDRQVIKTPTGYSFVVLHGDNNVWEDNKRRARDWSCWILDKTEEEIAKYFESWKSGYEHFKYNGKWIDDEGLIKWANNGIKNAKTIEEIKMLRPTLSIKCYLGIWQGDNYSTELDTYIHNTNDFSRWIVDANNRMQNKSNNEQIFICVGFGVKEVLNLGKIPKGPVVLKQKSRFVVEVDKINKSWKTCSNEIDKAIIFDSAEDASPYLRHNHGGRYDLKIVSANVLKKKDIPTNYVILMLDENNNHVGYYSRSSKSGVYRSMYVSSARKLTLSQAKNVVNRLKNRCFSIKFNYEIVEMSK